MGLSESQLKRRFSQLLGGASACFLTLRCRLTNTTPAMSVFRKINLNQLKQVKKLSAEIFGESYNPTGIRNGAEVLRTPLKGPEIAAYYGVNESAPTFKDFKKWFPELNLIDPREAYRMRMVIDRKKRNKGAPKKKSS